ncbi:hypothetical protein [Hoeflea poritis]|uniref:Uncharacterized protein n=1 Tax=Hoeflea poritis TaxID=2993659 RepID=A0ABT4VMK2_9HYPH|nr:hypothetical protein [Hoeflea poritis]MDA4845891.1 hypothetical protein [Hoeflea poritis]
MSVVILNVSFGKGMISYSNLPGIAGDPLFSYQQICLSTLLCRAVLQARSFVSRGEMLKGMPAARVTSLLAWLSYSPCLRTASHNEAMAGRELSDDQHFTCDRPREAELWCHTNRQT